VAAAAHYLQCDQTIWKNKITKIWQKVAKKSPSKKNARIANLKVQNIYNKALFKV
jgi:hypothetical protein